MILDSWTRGGKKIAYLTNTHFHSFSLIASAVMSFPTQQLTKNTSLCSYPVRLQPAFPSPKSKFLFSKSAGIEVKAFAERLCRLCVKACKP